MVKTDIRSYNISISEKRHRISFALSSHVWHARALITVTFRPSDRLSPLLVAALAHPRGGETNRRAPLAPQRGAARMRAPIRRISIRVATLGEAGQFSPVREIGPLYPIAVRVIRLVYRDCLSSIRAVSTRVSLPPTENENVCDANRGLETPSSDGGRHVSLRDTCIRLRDAAGYRLC